MANCHPFQTTVVLVLSVLVGLTSAGATLGDDRTVPLAMSEPYRINLEQNLRWMLDRERSAVARARDADSPEPPARVGVFADAGVWHLGARSIVEALEQEGIPCLVLDRTLTSKRLSTLEAIVLPGGWAPYELAALDQSAQQSIKDFVERGGRCLGICAGAYLVSRTVRYEDKDYAYPIQLFDGVAAGPVGGLAAWPDRGPARLTVTHEGRDLGLADVERRDVYYGGGPSFVGGTDVVTLARYHDGTPAVIRRPFGRGDVVLIGVHFERPSPTESGDDAPAPPIAGKVLKRLTCRPKAPLPDSANP